MAEVKLNRRERAARTRATIVEAAHQLLLERGWEATTMQAVADKAGFAVQTVYFVFGTKAQLVAAVEEHAIVGGTSRDDFLTDWRSQLAAESDPALLIRSFVETDTRIKSRLAPLIASLGGTIPAELVPARDRASGRDRFFAGLVDRLVELQSLRQGLGRNRAIDILRVLNALETYVDLTQDHGWSDQEWTDWMSDLLTGQLLRSTISSDSKRRPRTSGAAKD